MNSQRITVLAGNRMLMAIAKMIMMILAPLLGSAAISGAAEAAVPVGVALCSDHRLPAPPHASDSLPPCDPDKPH